MSLIRWILSRFLCLIFCIDKTVLPELKKLTKPAFDIDSISSSAEELKYVGAIKRAIAEEFKNPSQDLVKLFAKTLLLSSNRLLLQR